MGPVTSMSWGTRQEKIDASDRTLNAARPGTAGATIDNLAAGARYNEVHTVLLRGQDDSSRTPTTVSLSDRTSSLTLRIGASLVSAADFRNRSKNESWAANASSE